MSEKTIGDVPWTRNDFISAYHSIRAIYDQRPIADNGGGMKLPHLAACWLYLTFVRPKVIIESGVYKGQGTWFFKKACPDALIFSIETTPSHVVVKNPDGVYLDQDITTHDWESMMSGFAPEETLVFFDDHQNALDRIKWMVEKTRFRKAIFEDNYPPGDNGDCYSLKRAFDNNEDAEYLRHALKTYYEFPPIFTGERTRWGTMWSDYDTPPPLFDLLPDEGSVEADEMNDYTWICYAEIK